MIVICGGCLEVWDPDFDPCACVCQDGDPEYEDWHILVDASTIPDLRSN